MEHNASQPQKTFTGTVVSVASKHTCIVRVDHTVQHPKYKKQFIRSKRFAVDDQNNEAKLGMTVAFEHCRPISKTKRWRLVKIIK